MRKVLIVSPHFAPVNTADMHRVRLCLPWLREQGWEPTVLAVAPESIEGAVIEPLLEKTYPDDIRIIRVRGISPKLTRRFGIGSLWLRCGRALRKAGDMLLKQEKFDLVFFSTTTFNSFSLGPRWLRKFRVPYVLDYHDPWINDYYDRTGTPPPGGRLKYAFSQWQAKRHEPEVVLNAAQIVSVSSSYGPELCKHYPTLLPKKIHYLPFGASPKDIEVARTHSPTSPLVPFGDGNVHFVYTGRVDADMTHSLRILFRAFSLYKKNHPSESARMRFHFIGTDYAPPPLGRERVMPIAQAEEVVDHVTEHCYRVPYFDALSYLCHADALMLIGSDDPRYSASKVFPYLFAQRPLITIAHHSSLMLQLTGAQEHTSNYALVDNGCQEDEHTVIQRIYDEWFAQGGYRQCPKPNSSALQAHSAAEMTKRLSTVFYGALDSRPPKLSPSLSLTSTSLN